MPKQDTRSAPSGASQSLFKDVGPEELDALADKCWRVCRDKDPGLSVLINATRSGRLTFEELAEAMWCLGFIKGTNSVVTAVEARIAEVRAAPPSGEGASS